MSSQTKPRRLVVKVGTSTLTHHGTGALHLRRIEALVRTMSDLKNAGWQVILVSSGAQAAGLARLGLEKKPDDMGCKQATSAVGQCNLLHIYDTLFNEYGHIVGQILMTRADVDSPERKLNLENTFNALLSYGAVPVINENDSVSAYEIMFGDNDTLSAVVAGLVRADLLVLLTDIDGLYDADPRTDPNARRIRVVTEITESLKAVAGGAGSNRGTGGMQTKLMAADIATKQGVDMVIAHGQNPAILYDIVQGEPIGTLFAAKTAERGLNANETGEGTGAGR